MLLSFAFTPSTASLLSPSFRPGRVRFATFAPWCLALISCCSASWCLSAGLVLDCASPLAVHGPGFASLPGPPIARLSALSVFACVHLDFGFPRCLPHLSRGGCCDVGWVHDCNVALHSSLLAVCIFSCLLRLLLCFSLFHWVFFDFLHPLLIGGGVTG